MQRGVVSLDVLERAHENEQAHRLRPVLPILGIDTYDFGYLIACLIAYLIACLAPVSGEVGKL